MKNQATSGALIGIILAGPLIAIATLFPAFRTYAATNYSFVLDKGGKSISSQISSADTVVGDPFVDCKTAPTKFVLNGTPVSKIDSLTQIAIKDTFVAECPSNGLFGATILFSITGFQASDSANYLATMKSYQTNGMITTPQSTKNVVVENPNNVDLSKVGVAVQPKAGSTEDTDAGIDNCSLQLTNPLSWFICPIIDGLVAATSAMENIIISLMTVDATMIFNTAPGSTGEAYYKAWNTFRIIGIALIVIAGLFMIISQALGLEIFDAYTIKKVLPRLFIAAIAISLSWFLLKFLCVLTNDVGQAVRTIIYYPFDSLNSGGLTLGAEAIVTIFAGGALFALGIMGVLSLVATAALAALVAFAVLVIRYLVIIFLIIIAPIAIACYVLPNTEKAYKLWWESLSKALLMFPIIMAIIATGHVFAKTAYAYDGGAGSTINSIIALLAYFLPYFMLPFAFRLAGGAIATIAGLANDRSRGAFDRLSRYRGGQVERNMQRARDGERFNNNALNTMTAHATTRNFGLGRRGQAAYTQKKNIAAMRHAKSDAGQAGQHNDGMLRAQTYASETEARNHMAADWGMGAAEIDRSVAAAQANGGFGENRQVYAAKRLAETGTGYDNLQQVAQTVARVSNGNEDMIEDLAGNINYSTKAANRWDLAPGAGNLIALSRGEAGMQFEDMLAPGEPGHRPVAQRGISIADHHAATVAAARGTDAMSQMRGKPAEIRNTTEALTQHARTLHLRAQNAQTEEERQAATNEFIDTMGQMEQLNTYKGYGSVDNQEYVNTMLDETRDLREQVLAGLVGTTPAQAGPQILGPNGQPARTPTPARTPQQQANAERYERATARTRYDPRTDPTLNP